MDSRLQSILLCGNYSKAASIVETLPIELPKCECVEIFSIAGLHTKALGLDSLDRTNDVMFENAIVWAFARAGHTEAAFDRYLSWTHGETSVEICDETKAWIHLKMLKYEASHAACPDIVDAVLTRYTYRRWQVLSDVCNVILMDSYAKRYLSRYSIRVLREVAHIDDVLALVLRTYSIEAGRIALERFGAILEKYCICALKGHSAWLSGDIDRAEGYLSQAYSIDSCNAQIAFWLGRVHQRTGKPDVAVQMFKRALEIDATHFEAQVQLCRTLVRLSEYALARNVLLSLNAHALANVNVLRLNTTLRKMGHGALTLVGQLLLSTLFHRATRSWAKYLHRVSLVSL